MDAGLSPRVCSSKKRVVYKASSWRVHEFEIWSGELVCRAVALRVEGGVLVWLGGGGAAQLTEIALGVPARSELSGCKALATPLMGPEGGAAVLARKLAALLERPVYVSTGVEFDRFTMPLVERGLVAEIKSRPECFM